jgi:F420-non-reducing hydrogenase iron-sulfur subunit
VATRKRLHFLKQLLSFSGIDEARLRYKWISSAEAPEFAEEISTFIEELKQRGPSPLNKSEAGRAAA